MHTHACRPHHRVCPVPIAGPIPASLASSAALRTLRGARNSISSFPAGLVALPSLDVLDLCSNRLEGPGPLAGVAVAADGNLTSGAQLGVQQLFCRTPAGSPEGRHGFVLLCVCICACDCVWCAFPHVSGFAWLLCVLEGHLDEQHAARLIEKLLCSVKACYCCYGIDMALVALARLACGACVSDDNLHLSSSWAE